MVMNDQDILLITGSVVIFGSQVTPLQVFGMVSFFIMNVTDSVVGYSIALGGLVLFKTSGGK